MKKIFEIEKNIFNLKGLKVEFNNLIKEGNKYFHCKNFSNIFGNMSASKLLYNFTECKMPEDCLISIYFIPVEKPKNYEIFYKYDSCSIPKEVLLFIGSYDGENAEYICPIFPPYIDAKAADEIMAKVLKL